MDAIRYPYHTKNFIQQIISFIFPVLTYLIGPYHVKKLISYLLLYLLNEKK